MKGNTETQQKKMKEENKTAQAEIKKRKRKTLYLSKRKNIYILCNFDTFSHSLIQATKYVK